MAQRQRLAVGRYLADPVVEVTDEHLRRAHGRNNVFQGLFL